MDALVLLGSFFVLMMIGLPVALFGCFPFLPK